METRKENKCIAQNLLTQDGMNDWRELCDLTDDPPR